MVALTVSLPCLSRRALIISLSHCLNLLSRAIAVMIPHTWFLDGREGGREGGREEGREGGREGGRKGGREGGGCGQGQRVREDMEGNSAFS